MSQTSRATGGDLQVKLKWLCFHTPGPVTERFKCKGRVFQCTPLWNSSEFRYLATMNSVGRGWCGSVLILVKTRLQPFEKAAKPNLVRCSMITRVQGPFRLRGAWCIWIRKDVGHVAEFSCKVVQIILVDVDMPTTRFCRLNQVVGVWV